MFFLLIQEFGPLPHSAKANLLKVNDYGNYFDLLRKVKQILFFCSFKGSVRTTARSKISSDQKRFFIALSLYLPSFFANTPFKYWKSTNKKPENPRYFSLFLFLKIIRIYKEERLCAKLAIQSSNQQVSTINEKDKYIFYLLLYNKTRHSYIYF